MNHSAHPPGALEGDTVSPGVQAGSPRSSSPKSGGANNAHEAGKPPLNSEAWAPFNDCGGVDSDTQRGISRTSEIQPERAGASPRELRELSSRCNSGPQSPLSTLIAVLTVPAIVVAVGLVWSQL